MALHHAIHNQRQKSCKTLYVFSLSFIQSLMSLAHLLNQNHQSPDELLTRRWSRLFIHLNDYLGEAYEDGKYWFRRRKIL